MEKEIKEINGEFEFTRYYDLPNIIKQDIKENDKWKLQIEILNDKRRDTNVVIDTLMEQNEKRREENEKLKKENEKLKEEWDEINAECGARMNKEQEKELKPALILKN